MYRSCMLLLLAWFKERLQVRSLHTDKAWTSNGRDGIRRDLASKSVESDSVLAATDSSYNMHERYESTLYSQYVP
jgi:hypothetical protein